jgi:hypothetical protein
MGDGGIAAVLVAMTVGEGGSVGPGDDVGVDVAARVAVGEAETAVTGSVALGSSGEPPQPASSAFTTPAAAPMRRRRRDSRPGGT